VGCRRADLFAFWREAARYLDLEPHEEIAKRFPCSASKNAPPPERVAKLVAERVALTNASRIERHRPKTRRSEFRLWWMS